MTNVLTLGVGTLSIHLTEAAFIPGQTIRGVVELALTEPLEASRLVVGVDARQRIIAPDTPAIRRAVVWRLEKGLEKAATFESLKKAFSLKLPAELDPVVPANAATLGLVGRGKPKPVPMEWSVYAYLERPWAAAPKARTPIEVTLPKRRVGAARAVSVG